MHARIYKFVGSFSCAQIDSRKARERDLAAFDENRRAAGMLTPMRDKNEGTYGRGEDTAPACDHGLSRSWKANVRQKNILRLFFAKLIACEQKHNPNQPHAVEFYPPNSKKNYRDNWYLGSLPKADLRDTILLRPSCAKSIICKQNHNPNQPNPVEFYRPTSKKYYLENWPFDHIIAPSCAKLIICKQNHNPNQPNPVEFYRPTSKKYYLENWPFGILTKKAISSLKDNIKTKNQLNASLFCEIIYQY